MPVRTVEGIFKKLGRKEGLEFIRDYVYGGVTRVQDAPIPAIVNFLETSRRKMAEDVTAADDAIVVFNEMERAGQI